MTPAPRAGDQVVTGGDLVARYAREQVRVLLALDGPLRRDDARAVHDARVAARRLRSVLRTFRPLLAVDVTEPLRGELRWWGEVLGAARDREVQRDRVLAALDELGPSRVVGPVRARVADELGVGYELAHAATVQLMDHDRYLELVGALRRLAEDVPASDRGSRPAEKEARRACRWTWRRLKRRYRVVEEQVERLEEPWREDDEPVWSIDAGAPGTDGPDATDPALAEAVHELRKAAKAARYAGEACTPALGPRARRFAAACEGLQDLLGEHHDAVVLAAVLRDMGARARLAGEDGTSYDLLLDLEQARARAAVRDLDEAWRRVRQRRVRRR